jgi:hypothetical protein
MESSHQAIAQSIEEWLQLAAVCNTMLKTGVDDDATCW